MKLLPLEFTIQTERLTLRIPSESDLPRVFSATRFKGFNDGMLWDPPETIEELRGPFERGLAQWREGEAYHFSIDAEDELVGRIALRPTEDPEILDIGYWTHPEHYGKGYMTEAAGAVIELGFKTMGAKAIVAGTADWNKASQRVLDKVGFRVVDVVKDGFVKCDSVACDVIYRLDYQRLD